MEWLKEEEKDVYTPGENLNNSLASGSNFFIDIYPGSLLSCQSIFSETFFIHFLVSLPFLQNSFSSEPLQRN